MLTLRGARIVSLFAPLVQLLSASQSVCGAVGFRRGTNRFLFVPAAANAGRLRA